MDVTENKACRFCLDDLDPRDTICLKIQCQEYYQTACLKSLPCGHSCLGIVDEQICLPCLRCKPPVAASQRATASDLCTVCFTDTLESAPSIQLQCGHIFHFNCVKRILKNRWIGPRVTFGFTLCPTCKDPIHHPSLETLLGPIQELFDDVKRKALVRLEHDGLRKTSEVTSPGNRFYDNPAGFAMDRYAYFLCDKCGKAYFGGEARCQNNVLNDLDYNPKQLICGACSSPDRQEVCSKHGTDYIEYKCRFCCSMAVYYCFGTTHFCNVCHDNNARVVQLLNSNALPLCPAGPNGAKLEGSSCPLQIDHPPTGVEFSLGCGLCLDIRSF